MRQDVFGQCPWSGTRACIRRRNALLAAGDNVRASRSSTSVRTPHRPSKLASVAPTGPSPTITTSNSGEQDLFCMGLSFPQAGRTFNAAAQCVRQADVRADMPQASLTVRGS